MDFADGPRYGVSARHPRTIPKRCRAASVRQIVLSAGKHRPRSVHVSGPNEPLSLQHPANSANRRNQPFCILRNQQRHADSCRNIHPSRRVSAGGSSRFRRFPIHRTIPKGFAQSIRHRRSLSAGIQQRSSDTRTETKPLPIVLPVAPQFRVRRLQKSKISPPDRVPTRLFVGCVRKNVPAFPYFLHRLLGMISVCMATYNGEKYIREQIDLSLIHI